jgi:drug/metabolite transporter (DMT)-like permease
VNGYCAAAVAVLIWASYPVATRAAITGSFSPQELVVLRFGVGALLFLPYLLLHFRAITRATWLQGVPLTVCQGLGMGALVICGLQFAPANHQAALGPGISSAWVTLLGFVVFARRPSARAVVGATLCMAGVLALTYWTASERSASVLVGDAMLQRQRSARFTCSFAVGVWCDPGAAIVTFTPVDRGSMASLVCARIA